MQKIGDITNTADKNGEFTNGNVAAGIAPTLLDAGWFNTVQRELINAVQGSGIKLDSKNDSQLFAAIKKLIDSSAVEVHDASLTQKGITQLTDKTGSSNTLAATQKLVTDVNNNANTKLSKSQNGADIPDKNAFVKNLGLAETVERANGAYQKSGGVVNGNVDATGSIYGRGVYDTGVRVYSATNKPSPGELGAYTITESNSLIVPVGVPLPYPHRYTPQGYLTCNGQTFDKSLYPKLAEAYPAGRVPDLRGEFIRGWDDSRGVDPGRVCGTWQGDSTKRIQLAAGYGNENSYLWTYQGAPSGYKYPLGRDAIGNATDTSIANNTSGHETRPRNIAFNYIVRAA
ncbi:tail fiber protein [Photorhabdus temperata subsp. temperata]